MERLRLHRLGPADIEKMALAPCPAQFQFYVTERYRRKRLSCQLFQRSGEVCFSDYALLT